VCRIVVVSSVVRSFPAERMLPDDGRLLPKHVGAST
jgi:hypothetical protein